MPNFIEIGQTSLEKSVTKLGLGQQKLFCHGQKRDYLSRDSQRARGATKNTEKYIYSKCLTAVNEKVNEVSW